MSPDVWYVKQPDNFDYVRFSKDGVRCVRRSDVVAEVLRDFATNRLQNAGAFPAVYVREQTRQETP